MSTAEGAAERRRVELARGVRVCVTASVCGTVSGRTTPPPAARAPLLKPQTGGLNKLVDCIFSSGLRGTAGATAKIKYRASRRRGKRLLSCRSIVFLKRKMY
ncbi:hypothetical protein NDU88_011374 [Pleurodeles waltl]|uniref:Uncharacterized protein n=1 Tax=Pleurodeles waltl TaxID=8319 RepID=A0AAV7S1L3_PLEWA|nr:hypothetical protein NDU88_011374 [Pleurodeles waltl]